MVWIGFKFAFGVLLFLVALYVALSVGVFLLVKLGEWSERDITKFYKKLEEDRKQKREDEEKLKLPINQDRSLDS